MVCVCVSGVVWCGVGGCGLEGIGGSAGLQLGQVAQVVRFHSADASGMAWHWGGVHVCVCVLLRRAAGVCGHAQPRLTEERILGWLLGNYPGARAGGICGWKGSATVWVQGESGQTP